PVGETQAILERGDVGARIRDLAPVLREELQVGDGEERAREEQDRRHDVRGTVVLKGAFRVVPGPAHAPPKTAAQPARSSGRAPTRSSKSGPVERTRADRGTTDTGNAPTSWSSLPGISSCTYTAARPGPLSFSA